MDQLPEIVEGLPNICGSEALLEKTVAQRPTAPLYREAGGVDFGRTKAAAAIALHMHQPLVPAGGADLRTAGMIGNLQYMYEHQGIGDNHNAGVFQWCYRRMGEFIPRLLAEGKQPRVMLDYSGTLLHGLVQMGARDVIDALRPLATDRAMMHTTEWLGTAWGHAVAPSTPVSDFKLHVTAWQHHFAAIFGLPALQRVRGFSPSEMALPNHPDVAYAYVKTLSDAGYQWLLVQEHTVEDPKTGRGPSHKYLPHRLEVRSSDGETASIIAIVKTQGSDTKLVAQMQPYYEAQSLSREQLGGKAIPPLVTQIADGENGGVMMNEFPGKYMEVVHAASGSEVPLMNVTEYLEHLEAIGVRPSAFPVLQPAGQKRIWDRLGAATGRQKLSRVLDDLHREDPSFHVHGGSWTNDISWVRGYDNVLGPMEEVSVLFHQKVTSRGVPTQEPRYRNALYHLLISQSSDYRYWGQGQWTDYGMEICRRAQDILTYDF